ncbi:MAG TPA: hypothetical protein VFS02_09500 [Telluria sp.]|nr:hypothetical protein [Telluria sp.]
MGWSQAVVILQAGDFTTQVIAVAQFPAILFALQKRPTMPAWQWTIGAREDVAQKQREFHHAPRLNWVSVVLTRALWQNENKSIACFAIQETGKRLAGVLLF